MIIDEKLNPRSNTNCEYEEKNIEYAKQVLVNIINTNPNLLQFLRGSNKKFNSYDSLKKVLTTMEKDHQFWNITNMTKNLSLRDDLICERKRQVNNKLESEKNGKLSLESKKELFATIVAEENFNNLQNMLHVIRSFKNDFNCEKKNILFFSKLSAMIDNFEKYQTTLMNFAQKNICMTSKIYTCYQFCKKESAKNLLSQCYKPSSIDVSEELSKNGVKVYDISKTKQNFFLHMTEISKWGANVNASDISAEIKYEKMHKYCYRSLSYTGAYEPLVFSSLDANCCLVFNDIKPKNIVTISCVDAYTMRIVNSKNAGDISIFSSTVPNFVSAKTLKAMTRDIVNEISIIDYLDEEHDERLKPCAVFCANKITDTDYLLAKKLGVPIFYTKYMCKTATVSFSPSTTTYDMYCDHYAQAFSNFIHPEQAK